ncbi:metal-response element-binding transcription factor 2 [Trichonephila clavipes]|nr:metal-response element-binding transcription factor 2 [Trichonephila clavipes]
MNNPLKDFRPESLCLLKETQEDYWCYARKGPHDFSVYTEKSSIYETPTKEKFRESTDVLVRWTDGLLYLATIIQVEDEYSRCAVKFEDGSQFWALYKDIYKEYAAPIWAPASSSSKEKIDTFQYRTSKIIIGAISSTNNLSVEIECGLTPLESSRKLATVKFTNKIRSNSEEHISNVTFWAWTNRERLKRSPTLQYNKDIRNNISLNHTCLDIIEEPYFAVKPPSTIKINIDLLKPCSKKEPQEIIKRKGMDTVMAHSVEYSALTQNTVFSGLVFIFYSQLFLVTSELLGMRSPGSAVALAQTFRPALQCYNIQ